MTRVSREVRFRRRAEGFEILGHGMLGADDAGEYGAPLEVLSGVSIASFQRAVRDAWQYMDGDDDTEPLGIWVADVPLAEFDSESALAGPIWFEIGPRDFAVAIVGGVEVALRDRELAEFLRFVAAERGCEVLSLELRQRPTFSECCIRIRTPTRGRTLGDAYAEGADLLALLEALHGDDMTAEAAAKLIRGKQARALIGLRESSWLEVKSGPYDLTVDAGSIELAQDVSRFANAEEGGLLVVGLATRRTRDGEVIRAVRPIRLDRIRARQYLILLDRRIFPSVRGLKVESVELDRERGMLYVLVPEQPEHLKPFLVHGAIVKGKIEGGFMSIVRRRGDGSIPITPAEIHSWIVAGRRIPGERGTHGKSDD